MTQMDVRIQSLVKNVVSTQKTSSKIHTNP
jgi:hypothetical protein